MAKVINTSDKDNENDNDHNNGNDNLTFQNAWIGTDEHYGNKHD